MTDHQSSEKLLQRQSGLNLIADTFNLSLTGLINSYSGKLFLNSTVEKSSFFQECLDLKLSVDSEELLAERCRLTYHRDIRSSVEYGLDLVFGWMSEDLILHLLRSREFKIELSGEDRFREFLNVSAIGTASDYSIMLEGKPRSLELIISWNGYWERTNCLDLRDSKFRHLTQQGNESVCLGLELPSLKAFFLDMKDYKSQFVERINPAWGKKKVFTFSGIGRELHPIPDLLESI